ncbi:MAG: choice-of-anchor J domain-containing protein [candidate division WOR-3 bacterium]
MLKRGDWHLLTVPERQATAAAACRLIAACCLLIAIPVWAFEQSFTDSVFPPPGWQAVNGDSGFRTWIRFDLAARTPPACAYCGWENVYIRNFDWLITPQCSVRAGDRLSFWCRAQDEAYRESVEVWVSTGSPRLPDFQQLAAFGTNSVSYEYREYDLSTYEGRRVFLGLVYRSHNQYGLLLDDVAGPEEWFPAHDVGVTRVVSPKGAMRVGSVVRPACWVRSFALAAEWVRVSYDIENLWHGDTNVSLAGGESLLVSFPEVAFWQPDTYGVTFATLLGSDQRFWNDTAKAEVRVYPFQSRGGPDSLGYAWFDSDDPLGPEFHWQELYPAGTLLGWGDDTTFLLSLAWPFRLYGREYSLAWVSTNGWIGFGPPAQSNSSASNGPIPDPLSPNRALYPFWDDLWVKGNEGGIWYQYFGDTLLVIEWHNTRRADCELCSLHFEAKLFRSGRIEFHYASVDAGDTAYDQGQSATVGIEDHGGRCGLQYLYDANPPGNLLTSGRAIRFLPLPPGLAEEELRLNCARPMATIVRDMLWLRGCSQPVLLDIAGRRLLDLHSGPNDVRQFAPGVYFVRLQAGAERRIVKVVLE